MDNTTRPGCNEMYTDRTGAGRDDVKSHDESDT